jgi:uncharacterized protein YkwD
MRRQAVASFVVLVASAVLAACGGGGGGSSGGGGPTPPTPTPTATPATYSLSGTVLQIPSDAYGPTTIMGTTYQSADAGNTTPLANAIVVVGPVPIVGATPPATLPAGDVGVTTSATGAFTATLAAAPAPPSTAEPFVLPSNNITGFAPPASGYYVEVFARGADGLSAGVPIPVHRFVAAGSPTVLRVTSPTSAEAGALATVNADRANNAGASPLTFDEAAEEVARLHASDMALQQYACHYDQRNVGPSSRFLAVGGIGLTGETIGGSAGTTTPAQGFAQIEADVVNEKTQSPPGGHYANLTDVAHQWAGLAAATNPAWAGTQYAGDYDVDYELVTPSAQDSVVASSGYPVASGCPTGTTDNNS